MAMQSSRKITSAPSLETIDQYYNAMRPFWHPVLPSEDLADGKLCGVELLEEPLVLARLNGQTVALQDLCRHFQARLSLGAIEKVAGSGDCIICPYHGWQYNAEGHCVRIPQLTPGRQVPREARVPAYHTQERYGLIWVCLAEKPRFPLPELPGLEDDRFLLGPIRRYPSWTASAPRVIMAALDDTHAPWVHGGLLGDRSHPEAPDHMVGRDGQYLKVQFIMLQPDNRALAGHGNDNQLREVQISTLVGMPNVIHFQIQPRDADGQQCMIIWQAVSPRRYNQTDTYWGSARNFNLSAPAYDEEFEKMQDLVREQDRRVVESQRPWLLPPFWTKLELPLRPADLPLIEYHRWLEELGISLAL
ncbi:MAG TPA: aromatic ring-hydroxylating dioxygenase subunit alpha [Chloroflexota bacterium]|nr:aromatic ring-hydroxylating dioxygenase subunit alpha [Chloroflexota bacterium]